MMKCGIYRIICIQNLKSYFGSTSNYKKRISTHKCKLRKNKHNNPILQASWNKYGKNSFTFEFIEDVEEKDLIIREQCYLDMMFSEDKSDLYGFNVNPIACKPPSRKGIKHTEEARRKISDAGRRPCSESKKEKISKSVTGFKHSNEAKEKMSVSAKKNSKIRKRNDKGWFI